MLVGSILTPFQAAAQSIPAPPCRQVDVDTDTTKRRLLYEFIDASLKNRRFVNDKGIVQLNVYKNKEGLTCWMLIPHIDDQYKDNPPPTFDDLNGDIILVYPADVNGYELKTPNPEALNKCLEAVIGDRVYRRPTIKGRWTRYKLPGMDRIFTEGVHRDETGSGGAIIIIFQKDGTYKKVYPA